MTNQRSIWKSAALAALVVALPATGQEATGWNPARLDRAAAEIDALVAQGRRAANVRATGRTDDATFARRAYVQIAGRIPTLEELQAFLGDRSGIKRTTLVDRLVDSPAFVSRMTNWWADLFRAKTRLTNQISGEPFLHEIQAAVAANRPYDDWVRELLTASGPAAQRGNGATGLLLRDYEMPHDSMANTVRVFLGTRIECAQCHDHPYDTWTQRQFYELSAFTGGIRYRDADAYRTGDARELFGMAREVRQKYGDAGRRAFTRLVRDMTYGLGGSGTGADRLPDDYQYPDARPGSFVAAKVPFGPQPELDDVAEVPGARRSAGRRRNAVTHYEIDSRAAFAAWVTAPDNPRFTRVIANRMWELAFGRGVIDPVDDLRDDTVVADPALMAGLETLMRDVDYDLRLFLKVLLRTDLFGREAVVAPDAGEAFHFPGPVLRRMRAEQLWDSLLSLAVDDPDATIRPLGARAEEVYARHEELSAMDQDELMARVELASLRDTDPAEYRRRIAAEVRERQQEMQGGSAERQKELREAAAPVLEELRAARRARDQRKVAELLAELRRIRATAGGGGGRGLVRASELPSPAPDGHLLREFGQSDRDVVDNAQVEANVPQALRLMNGFVDQQLMGRQSALPLRFATAADARQRVSTAFLAVLQREPTAAETRDWVRDVDARGDAALTDLVWTLVNSHEFRFVR